VRKCRITNFFIVQEQDDYPLQFKVWLGKIATEYKVAWSTKKAEMAARIMGGGEAVLTVTGLQGAMMPVPGNILNENVVTCPKGTDCSHLILQGNIFISEQLAGVVQECKQERRNIKTVLVNVRGVKTQSELCSIVSFIKQCANEKKFTGVVLLPDGTTGDTMKGTLVNILKEFGKVTCFAVVKTCPLEIMKAQEKPLLGRLGSGTVNSVIQWAVVVSFDDDGGRLDVPKGTMDLLMFPALSPQLKFKFQQASISSNTSETAIVDNEQLNPSLLAYIW
jgi:hypothetical protein